MKIRVGHLYPDYLNIYADRGNMAVLARRAAWRGIGFDYRTVTRDEQLRPGEHDLLYIGGGQDREQALIARDLAARAAALDRALAATPERGELVALPTYTAMLALRGIVGRRGYVKPYWEAA